ncbi:hypothetical protein CBR_g70703 [Chara braunii]|uniref:Uncharacterized protein n=1 Tax=Chara braunii TaxID=69332 RepID=A0A388K9U1_CHABU|nr:hypothetical protein CBR_g70703 [Chara braunii]|eukprot:GBG66825.1 hypothetical protein CBR_g70703 [Chara braunii]
MEWQKRWKLRPTGLAKQLEKDGATVSSAAPAVSSAEEEKASSSQPPSPSPPPQPTAVASTAASTSPAAGTAAATEPSPTKSMWGEEMVGVRKAASSAASAAGDAVSSAAKGAQLGGTKSFTPVTSFVGVGRGAKGVTTVGRVGTARGVAAIPARAGAGGVGAGVGVGGELGVSGVGGGGRGGGKAAVATSTGSAAAEGGSKGLPVTSPGAGGGGGLKAVPTAVAAAGRGAGGKGLSTGAGTKAGVGGGGKGTVASGTPAPWAKGVSPAPAGEGGGGMGGGGGGGMGGGGVGGMGGGGGGVGYSKAGTLSKVEAVTHTLGAKGAQAAGATAIPMGKKGTMSATAPWGGLRGSSPAKFGTGTGTLDTRGSMKGSEGGGSFKGDEAGKLSGRVTAGKVHTGGQGETMDLSSETGKLVKAAAAQFEAGIGEQVKIWLERDVSGASTRKIDANVDALVAEGEEQYEGIADSLDDDSTAFFEWDLESLQKRTWIWLELMLRERFPTGQTLGDLLADGEILVRLMKVLRPRLRLPDISNLLPKGAETTPALYKIGSRLGYYAVSNAATFLRVVPRLGIDLGEKLAPTCNIKQIIYM